MSNEITTPYDRVLIDSNEPLILPDGTAITGRLETFLYALCCLDYDNLPTPLSRIEEFANALITGEIPNIEPQSRSEQFFLGILDGNIDKLPEPQSRSEVLLNKLAVGDFDLTNIDPIQSRYELLLAYLIKNGGVGNLDYVLYEFYQATQTLYNTQEKPVKSAILKGNTLVNCINQKDFNPFYATRVEIDNGYVYTQNDYNKSTRIELNYTSNPLLSNEKYYLISFRLKINEQRTVNVVTDGTGYEDYSQRFSENADIFIKVKIKFAPNGTKLRIYVRCENDLDYTDDAFEIRELMLIEYQDGMENWDIPYFEGMKSVQMPVLKTVGKNLLSSNMFNATGINTSNGIISPSTERITTDYLIIDNSVDYIFSGITTRCFNYVYYYDINYNFIGRTGSGSQAIRSIKANDGTVADSSYKKDIIPVNCKYIVLTLAPNISIGEITQEELFETSKFIQLEKSTSATTYEPHKSNILTVNEDVELGSVGEVKDELDLLTGKITQRTDIRPYQESDESDSEVLTDMTNTRYKLAQEVVKTVDLSVIDQDGNVLPKIKTFNDTTYVNVSSDGILPKVEMEVATYNEEDIANVNVMIASMDEICSVQNELDNTNSIQSEEIDSTMIASTEIYENIL